MCEPRHAHGLRCISPVLQFCSLARAHFFLLHLYLKWQSPHSRLNYVVQVQSARKSNCTGCMELPETDWKLRAELSGAPRGFTRLCVCVFYMSVCAPVTSQQEQHYVFILHAHVLHVAMLPCTSLLCVCIDASVGNDMHLLTKRRSVYTACVSSPGGWQLHRADPLVPWQWQSSPQDLSAPSHMPSGPWNLLDVWAITLQ